MNDTISHLAANDNLDLGPIRPGSSTISEAIVRRPQNWVKNSQVTLGIQVVVPLSPAPPSA
ncbi:MULTISPECIES: hypothetical protein [Sorangium]|uniref:Uncharacterized protein n=1 Tax=Sorangium cellulosum TaxID=56 RepID=A0A4P2R637_SORCE|nr:MULTISPECIES: hypothetical protein [Sorangium]AUX38286.1 uncharacterized protein SOCE836_105270 [Sorangium cellulosum]WCQ97573.1 hypothetical protein NQZ70_10367 [Sorangium sp. Soce836]